MRDNVLVDMKLLVKHVKRATFLACVWDNVTIKLTVGSVENMYSIIFYRLIFPNKTGKKRRCKCHIPYVLLVYSIKLG